MWQQLIFLPPRPHFDSDGRLTRAVLTSTRVCLLFRSSYIVNGIAIRDTER